MDTMEETLQTNAVDYTAEKKYCSGIGIRYFVISIVFLIVQLAAILLVNALSSSALQKYYLLISMLPAYIVLIPLLWGMFHKGDSEPLAVGKLSAGQLVSAFFISYAFMYLGNLVGTLLNYIVSAIVNVEATNSLQDLLNISNTFQIFLVVVICAPILEEFLFRKILIDRLHRYGDKVAIVVSALMFGFYHGNITQFVYATLLGLVFGYVYAKSGNIRYSIGLHMVVNFFGSVLSQLVTEKSGYLDMATELTENPDAAADIVMAHAAGLGLFFLWAVLLLGFMIAGIVLFFVKRKQLTFGPGVVTLEKGKRFSTIVGNLGAILFIIFWIVLSLFNMGIL